MSDVQKIQSAGAVDPIAVVWSVSNERRTRVDALAAPRACNTSIQQRTCSFLGGAPAECQHSLQAAGDGTGHSVNQHWHDDNRYLLHCCPHSIADLQDSWAAYSSCGFIAVCRARDLQLKQESCAKSFDVFIRSCSEHQPAAAAMFQVRRAAGAQRVSLYRHSEVGIARMCQLCNLGPLALTPAPWNPACRSSGHMACHWQVAGRSCVSRHSRSCTMPQLSTNSCRLNTR